MTKSLSVPILLLAGILQAITFEDLKELSKEKFGIFKLYLEDFDSPETPADKINKIMTEVFGFKSDRSRPNWFNFLVGKETIPSYGYKKDFGKDDEYFKDLLSEKIENNFEKLIVAQEKEEEAEKKAEDQLKI